MNFKEALIAHLQGEGVEFQHDEWGLKWLPIIKIINQSDLTICDVLSDGFGEEIKFRLAPRTIFVNGVEVPAPESVAPKEGCFVYVADPASNLHHFSIKWVSVCEQYIEYLQCGLVYLNKEDAIARAKAMLIVQEKN